MKLFNLTILFSLLFIYSCEDKIDIDVPEGDEKLVVDGIFSNDENSVIILSKTAPYFNDGRTPRATNATVMITSDANDTIQLVESADAPGNYVAQEAGEIGKTYTLHIRLSTGELYESLPEKMNRITPIDSIYYKDAEEVDDPFLDEGFVVLFDTKEPLGVGDYYRWIYYLNGVPITGPDDLFFNSDELVDGNTITEVSLVDGLVIGDSVLIKQLSITERNYNYLIQIMQITQVGGPFDSPPSPIKGNVKNKEAGKYDALGYFTVSGASQAEIVIK